jgi:hypothetical protein
LCSKIPVFLPVKFAEFFQQELPGWLANILLVAALRVLLDKLDLFDVESDRMNHMNLYVEPPYVHLGVRDQRRNAFEVKT